MLIYLDQIGDKKLKAPSTDDASKTVSGHVYSSSTASIRTAGGLSVEKRISVGQFDGRLPLGSVVPVIGTYSATNNTGTFTTATGIPASGVISDDGFMRCDGVEIPSDQEAKLLGFVPNISDERFIQGSTTAGFATVTNLSNVNQGNNYVKLTRSEMPSHNHGGNTGDTSISGGGTFLNDVKALFNSSSAPGYSPITLNDSGQLTIPGTGQIDNMWKRSATAGSSIHSHIISSQGLEHSFDIRPKYINAIYLIRVR